MSLPSFGVKNTVLANMTMLLIIIAGLIATKNIRREMFPYVEPDRIFITTVYKGASAEDIEKEVSIKIEDAVKTIDGIDTVTSFSSENISTVVLKLKEGLSERETDRVLEDVRTNVDKIDDLPEESEKPVIKKVRFKLPVITIVLYGKGGDMLFKKLGEKIKLDLQTLKGISDFHTNGLKDRIFEVSINPITLEKYSLTFQDIANSIKASNLDLTGGKIRTKSSDITIRTKGKIEKISDLRNIPIRTLGNSNVLYLKDVANLKETLDEEGPECRFNGQKAITFTIEKSRTEDAIKIVKEIRNYVKKLKNELPPNIHVTLTSDLSKYIRDRINLMKRNGLQGLVLVFISLIIFLNFRASFWTALGIPVSFLGAMWYFWIRGITLNMVVMFGLIMVLGMVVDDAIVICENVFKKFKDEKMDPIKAAIYGTEEVMWPVIATVTTTIAAFLPLTFMTGRMGKFMSVMPIVVTVVLLFSIFEALFILPAHLSETFQVKISEEKFKSYRNFLHLLDKKREELHLYLIEKYASLLKTVLKNKYIFVAIMISLLLISAAFMAFHLNIQVFPKVDSDYSYIKITMPVSTSKARTSKILKRIEDEIISLHDKNIKNITTYVGEQMDIGSTSRKPITLDPSVGMIFVEFRAAELRNESSETIIDKIRKKIAKIGGIEKVEFVKATGGPSGADIEVEVRGDNLKHIRKVVSKLKKYLATYEGVYDIDDNDRRGKRELLFYLNDRGKDLGITNQLLGSQLRGLYEGLKASEVRVGNEDVDVKIRLSKKYRENLGELRDLKLYNLNRDFMDLYHISNVKESEGLETIVRTDYRRAITVTADVNPNYNNPQKICNYISRDFKWVNKKYPDVKMRFKGAKEEARKSTQSLMGAFIIGGFIIFLILASLFKSYSQPLLVMSVIPFGIIGSIWGHIIMGYNISIISMIGIVALSGIVVNDSLVLIDFINRERKEIKDVDEAILTSGKNRFRAVILTTITTIFGLLPLILEKSLQAKFLIPMAISITFGLAFATTITLLLIPCFYSILEEIREKVRGWF